MAPSYLCANMFPGITFDQQVNACIAALPSGGGVCDARAMPVNTTMQANVDNYEQVSSLPDFRLFAVFFIVPGVLLILLAVFGLYGERAVETFHHRAHPTPA